MTESQPETVDEATGEVRAVVPRRPDALTEFGHDEIGMDRALAIANQLDAIIREKGLFVNMGKSDHLTVEAWTCCASMVGVAPKTAWTQEIRHPSTGDFEGNKARVEVIHLATGDIIGGAEASCFANETQKTRDGSYLHRWTDDCPRYEHPPVKPCASQVTRHAVESMAQTRATSKAIGQVLRWIPVLAGYSGTPAAEMPPSGYGDEPQEPAGPRGGDPEAPPSGEQTWGIGKNKGVAMSELPDDYLSWAINKPLDNKKWLAIAQAEAARRGHAPEPEKEEDPAMSTEDRKPMVAESYSRAEALINEVSQADGSLKYGEPNSLAASIRKRAMEHLGLEAGSIRKSNEEPMIAAIKIVDINADGETEIPEGSF